MYTAEFSFQYRFDQVCKKWKEMVMVENERK